MIPGLLWVLFSAGAVPPTPSSAPAPAGDEPRVADRVEALVVASESPSAGGLLEDLRPRVPELRLYDLVDLVDLAFDTSSVRLFAFVRITAIEDGEYEIDLVLSDGRAYARRVEATSDQASRSVASAIANLVAAIDEDVVAPDREDVPLPDLEPPTDLPNAPTSASPQPDPAPDPEPDPEPVRSPASSRPGRGATGLELGVALRGGPLLGLAPAPAGFHAFAGGLTAGVRSPRGVLAALDLRLAGARADGLQLLRGRLALGGGHGIRRGIFDMPILAVAWVEPWGIRSDGERLALAPTNGGGNDRSPLFGAGGRLSPGIVRSIGDRVAVRLGIRAELGASAQLDNGAKVARILTTEGASPSFRLGGLELEVALEVGLAIGVGMRRGAAAPP